MKLSNPFPLSVRTLYLGIWQCWICGSNGTSRGGLEIHHIMGRNSDSAFNSSLLCHSCHEHMCHSQEEEQMLFFKTLKFLKSIHYFPSQKDFDFMDKNKERLFNEEIMQWVEKL